MTIFWRLMFGHLLADFTFQANVVNDWKRKSVWGMLVHCLTHPLCYVVLTYPFLDDPWIDLPFLSLSGWACVIMIFIAHFAEDYWRVFTIFKFNTPDNTLYFIWDQIIHYAVIFAVIPLGLKTAPANLIPEAWPVLGCVFVLITHACTVLIYFIEKDVYGSEFPGGAEKYVGMLERLVLALLFLVPGHFYPLLAVGWISLMHFVRSRRILDLSWFGFYLGSAVAALGGLAARMIYYR